MFGISLPFILTLCSIIVSTQCDLTPDTSSAVQGFAFEMIMTKLQFLEDRFTEVEEQVVKKISDVCSRKENISKPKQNSETVRVYNSDSKPKHNSEKVLLYNWKSKVNSETVTVYKERARPLFQPLHLFAQNKSVVSQN
uniref:Uncharacterized protein n=1 Tax=Anopheles funestus TaxID=62324 RepID=A0A4Y0BIX3_ANOFN